MSFRTPDYDSRLALVGGRLPLEQPDRTVFCISYGDRFTGDHDEALRYAVFAVYYQKAMGLGAWAPPEPR